MKFRTELTPQPLAATIDYADEILTLGSCFATRIGERLAAARFRTVTNPTGVLFNPLSIAKALESFATDRPIAREELHAESGIWFHYDFHGSFSAPTPEMALQQMQTARRAGSNALRRATRLILTFGTAWVYDLRATGRTVANCHKQPADRFVRRRLTVEEIVARFDALLTGPLADKPIILTVSPVRHLADGLEQNSVSKATLRLAAEELRLRHPGQVEYFPAYELLMDDLRDYRFYADDLLHPSPAAVEYIWEHFTEAALSEQARRLLPEVEAVVRAAAHRPLHPTSDAHRRFCTEMLRRLEALPKVDWSRERPLFELGAAGKGR